MVTMGKGKAKPRVRRSSKLRVLEQKGAEILGKGGVVEAGPSLYLVSSESGGYRDVRHVGGLWYCDCPYFTSGHTTCRHICAVRIMILMRDGVRKIGHTTDVDVVKVHCPHCKSTDHHESTTYATRIGYSIVYRCHNPECGGRFTFRPGFKKRWYGNDTITDALVDAGSGHPPARIAERLKKNGVAVSERTIRRWIDDYADLVEGFTSTLQYSVGRQWSLDEKHVRTHPGGSKRKRWLCVIQDDATGLLTNSEMTDNKSAYDASRLIRDAIHRTGIVPDVVRADGLAGYKKGFENEVRPRNPAAVLIADVGINGRHVNNNRRERTNGELGDCWYRARGFRRPFPGLVLLTTLYYNFIHKQPSGLAPAEAAGVRVAGPDTFMTLIQNAALAAA